MERVGHDTENKQMQYNFEIVHKHICTETQHGFWVHVFGRSTKTGVYNKYTVYNKKGFYIFQLDGITIWG